jgi:hypothetical protein
MNRILAFCIIVALSLASSSCSTKKPPEQAAVKSKNALSALRQMTEAYERKDLDAFLADVAGSYRDRDGLAKGVAAVFARFPTVHFAAHTAKMIIMIDDKGLTRPSFTWEGEWIALDGSAVKDGGRTTFVFEPGTFKLIAIEGKNPFLAQPGDAPSPK